MNAALAIAKGGLKFSTELNFPRPLHATTKTAFVTARIIASLDDDDNNNRKNQTLFQALVS